MEIMGIKSNKLVGEFIGTFVLTFAVLASINGFIEGVTTPFVAGLAVLIAVLMVGVVSGSHINPAVTAALFSLGKIDAKHAAAYVATQMVAAFVAFITMNAFLGDGMIAVEGVEFWDGGTVLAEAFGAAFFTFGLAAALKHKFDGIAQATLIGGSLTIGIIFAVSAGSLGVLNPAVALALGVFNWSYVIGPVVGAIIGMNVYSYLMNGKK